MIRLNVKRVGVFIVDESIMGERGVIDFIKKNLLFDLMVIVIGDLYIIGFVVDLVFDFDFNYLVWVFKYFDFSMIFS